jgi:ribosome biogenesis GTPase
VDHVAVCVSLALELDLGRLERFVSLAWESGN